MVQRVNHGVLSATATTGWEFAKGGLKGALYAAAVGAVVGGLLIGGISAIFGGVATALVVGAIGAVAVGGITLLGFGSLATGVGALLGIAKGVHRVRDEKSAYIERQQILSGAQINQQNAMIQQVFAAGQQSVLEDLKQYQQMQIAKKMAACAKEQTPVVGPQTAKIAQERAAGQANSAQIG